MTTILQKGKKEHPPRWYRAPTRYAIATVGCSYRITPAHAGNTDRASRHACHFRITPAHAGNTPWAGQDNHAPQDHPRACGEHICGNNRLPSRLGSPPRMRRTPPRRFYPRKHFRITPAHAGNTPRGRSPFPRVRDHPRACGEHIFLSQILPKHPGSPPRMRGTRRRRG